MQFEPDGTIILLKDVPFSSDYKDTRSFASASEQTTYFQSKPKRVWINCSYTRGSRSCVCVDSNIEQLWDYNYMMYQNQTMGNKWFYAFVDNYEMVAAESTFVYFSIDVVQTWMFELNFAQCFVEREHVGIQKVGDKFWVPENLEIGTDYITVHEEFIDKVDTGAGSAVLITSTVNLGKDFGSFDNPNLVGADGGVFHQLPSGCSYYVVAPDKYGDASIYDIFNLMKDYPWVSKGIIGMTIVPIYALANIPIREIPVGGSTFYIGQINDDSIPLDATIYNQNVFSPFDAVPDNAKKLLMYPYSFIELSAQNGQTMIIKPQYLTGTQLMINRASVVSMSPEIKYYLNPGYCGLGSEYDFSISIKDFPQLPVQDTSYLLSIAQTQHDIKYNAERNLGNNVFSTIGNIVKGNGAALASGIFNAFMDTEQAIYKYNQAEVQSPTLNGQVNGTMFNYATGQMGLRLRWKMIANGYQDIISRFWNKFGYAVNILKTPSPNKMSRFDYLKTRDCKLTGSVPQDDKVKLINIYNNGITFWHDDNVGFYENNAGVL